MIKEDEDLLFTKEDKDLMLKDLCARIPYGIKCNVGDNKSYTLSRIEIDDKNGHLLDFIEMKYGLDMQVYLSEVKPYLFPLSTISDKIIDEIYNTIGVYDICIDSPIHIEIGTKFEDFAKIFDIFHKHHIDYRGLIKKGLAIDATKRNIY